MAHIRPLPGQALATANLGDEEALVVADYHAGIEAALRTEEGLEAPNRAERRRQTLLTAVDTVDPDRLVVLGDFMHSIGGPGGAERGELEVLVESLPSSVSVTLVKGNHDGDIGSWLPDIDITGTGGVRLGPVGFVHGHTWPDPSVLEAEVVCVGHEHPQVRLTDAVGGRRVERAWLRGQLQAAPFRAHDYPELTWRHPQVVVFPAYNELVGGTWVNVEDQEFLAPFLPAGLSEGSAFLLDGTDLGEYTTV